MALKTRPNSGFAVAENDAAGSSLFTTTGTGGRTRSANGGMEFQHFPDSVQAGIVGQAAVTSPGGEGAFDGWTNDRTSGQPASDQPAATGSFPNWHRLTQKKTSDDKKVDGLAR